MPLKSLRIGLIYGSVRHGRFCDTVVRWAMRELESQKDIRVDHIDPKALGLSLLATEASEKALDELRRKTQHSEAFIVVTPEYNHGYPAALKHVIDSVSNGWQLKPVAFISYGGISGGLRAVEQLRLVFSELYAITLRESVSLAHPWYKLDERRELVEPEARDALANVVERLKWWSGVLSVARQAGMYEAPAA